MSRPLVIAALDTVPSAATPAFLTACASSKPAVQAWAANSLQVLEFWRIPGKYLSMTVFMAVTAGAFEKNGRIGYGDHRWSFSPAVVSAWSVKPVPSVT